MARPLRIEYHGAYYHVTSRGNEQKDVFKSRMDREKFLSYLASATERYGAAIHAYCMMSNHYHLILETPDGNLSQIMRHINGAYTTYFNVKRKRAGHLFQGRYKAILVEADAYAAELSRYIHLNPVRAGLVARPEEYEWSSYCNYIGIANTPEWLKTDFILDNYSGKEAVATYQQFVNDGVKQEKVSPLQGVVAATILGKPEFVRQISQKHLVENTSDRNMPAVRKLSRPTMDEIIRIVGMVISKNDSRSRNIGIYFCHRYSGARLQEIGERFGLSSAAIAQASRRLRMASEEDAELRSLLHVVAKELGFVAG